MFKTDTELGVSALVLISGLCMIAQYLGVEMNAANVVAIAVGAIAALIKGVSTPTAETKDSTVTVHTQTTPEEVKK